MKSCTFNRGPRVLVVDDHEISRLHTVQALRQINADVKQAGTEKEALGIALRQLPDLICMDLHLEKTSGLSLLRLIRQSWPPEHSWPAVIMLTGDNSPRLTEQMESTPVSAVLIKPVTAEDIQNSCIRLLHLDRAVRETSRLPGKDIPPVKLRKIFLEELQTRLPELDQFIEKLDWASARSILHQLTASSAMCHEKDLERHCRELFDVLAGRPEPGAITRAYYPFLKAASCTGFPLQAW